MNKLYTVWIFQKKLLNSFKVKMLKQIFIEYKHMIQFVSIMWYFCFEFTDFMLKGKSLLEYTNLFSPNEYKKNDNMILKYFQ